MPRDKPTSVWGQPRDEIDSTWGRPRFVATAQLQDVDLNNILDVNGNNIFVIGQSGSGTLVPLINTNWN